MPDDAVQASLDLDGGGILGSLESTEPEQVETHEGGEVEVETTEQETHEGEETGAEEQKITSPEKMPSQVIKLLREVKAGNVESAPIVKALNDAYFAHGEYTKLFPNIDEAREVKATLDAIGGVTGIADLQTMVQGIERIDQMVDEGDPAVVEDMAKESPEGFTKLIHHGLEILEKMNSTEFDNTIRPSLVRSLINSGMGDYLADALESLEAGDTQGAARRISGISRWLGRLVEAEKGREKNVGPDPREEALKEQRLQLETEKQNITRDRVKGDIVSYLTDTISSGVKPLLKGQNFSQQQIDDLIDGVGREINATMGADKAYGSNLAALMRKGDIEKTEEYIKAKINAIRQKSINSVFNRRYSGVQARPAKKVVTAGKPGIQTETKPGVKAMAEIQVPQKPPDDAINWDRDPSMILRINHKGYLASGPNKGRLVHWP